MQRDVIMLWVVKEQALAVLGVGWVGVFPKGFGISIKALPFKQFYLLTNDICTRILSEELFINGSQIKGSFG